MVLGIHTGGSAQARIGIRAELRAEPVWNTPICLKSWPMPFNTTFLMWAVDYDSEFTGTFDVTPKVAFISGSNEAPMSWGRIFYSSIYKSIYSTLSKDRLLWLLKLFDIILAYALHMYKA